jgi:uncharacterized membrane protein YhdT
MNILQTLVALIALFIVIAASLVIPYRVKDKRIRGAIWTVEIAVIMAGMWLIEKYMPSATPQLSSVKQIFGLSLKLMSVLLAFLIGANISLFIMAQKKNIQESDEQK